MTDSPHYSITCAITVLAATHGNMSIITDMLVYNNDDL